MRKEPVHGKEKEVSLENLWEKFGVTKKMGETLKNVKFHLNKMKSEPDGDYIKNIHKKWKGKYKILEAEHSYIQWLFPLLNQGSKFNSKAMPLEYKEAVIFQEEIGIAERIVESYELMLDFFGIKLANKETGELKRSENFAERYQKTLIERPHNHLRISRIMGSLSTTGFRKYAKMLFDFLEKETYEPMSYQAVLSDPSLLEDLLKNSKNPLRLLAKGETFQFWSKFSRHTEEENKEKLIEALCAPKDFSFFPSVYFEERKEVPLVRFEKEEKPQSQTQNEKMKTQQKYGESISSKTLPKEVKVQGKQNVKVQGKQEGAQQLKVVGGPVLNKKDNVIRPLQKPKVTGPGAAKSANMIQSKKK